MIVRPPGSPGFALVAVLFVLLLLTSLGLYVQLQLGNQANLTSSVQTQLHSLVLAENGIEFARALLPHVELDELLLGPDGLHSGTATAEWRSPFSYADARRLDPSSWVLQSDDGWPAREGQLLLAQGYSSLDQGYFYLRFSNNPGEPVDHDEDGIVLVRSAGLVRSRVRDLFSRSSANDVTMIEAMLRQERVFDPKAALLLFGDSGEFLLNGAEFRIDGGDWPAVSIITQSSLEADLRNSVSPRHDTQFSGFDRTPSLLDRTLDFQTSRNSDAVFSPGFWSHFEKHVSSFTDSRQPGLFYYPTGGTLGADFQGVVVVKGDLAVNAARVTGLIVHLGGGRLILEDGTRITGGIWMSNVLTGNEQLVHGPLVLEVNGDAQVTYDAGRVREALTLLPPTQLGWRILFPEMKL